MWMAMKFPSPSTSTRATADEAMSPSTNVSRTARRARPPSEVARAAATRRTTVRSRPIWPTTEPIITMLKTRKYSPS